ncbi:MAG: TMEM175 family protein [Daejeonella sp.]
MKISTKRVETLSDSIIAIIITIMIIELKIPDLNDSNRKYEMIIMVNNLIPYFITYAFSFMMIGILWTNHHHMFHLLERTDAGLLWHNFLFLFLTSLIPFATSIVGSNPFLALSAAIYGSVMLLTSFSFLIMRDYSIRKKLLHKDSNREITRRIVRISFRGRTKTIIAVALYLISIPLAFVSVYLSYACMLVPPVIFFIPEAIDMDDEKVNVEIEQVQ